jgi:hypothetical protein
MTSPVPRVRAHDFRQQQLGQRFWRCPSNLDGLRPERRLNVHQRSLNEICPAVHVTVDGNGHLFHGGWLASYHFPFAFGRVGLTPSQEGSPNDSRRWLTELFPKSGKLNSASSEVSRPSPTVFKPANLYAFLVRVGRSV